MEQHRLVGRRPAQVVKHLLAEPLPESGPTSVSRAHRLAAASSAIIPHLRNRLPDQRTAQAEGVAEAEVAAVQSPLPPDRLLPLLRVGRGSRVPEEVQVHPNRRPLLSPRLSQV